MYYNNQDEFDEAHDKVCENSCWSQISGQYDANEYECSVCGARYTPKHTYFNSEASPEYDDDGRKIGSGEYQEVEFEGYIPDNMIEGCE